MNDQNNLVCRGAGDRLRHSGRRAVSTYRKDVISLLRQNEVKSEELEERYHNMIRSSPAVMTHQPVSIVTRSQLSDLFVLLNETDPLRWEKLFRVGVIGGKAIHLAELNIPTDTDVESSDAPFWGYEKALVPVQIPEAACCTTYAYVAYVHQLNLQPKFEQILTEYEEQMDKTTIEQKLQSIREEIINDKASKSTDPLPAELQSCIKKFLKSLPSSVKSLAVRSSSTLEDQEGSSFAGQYDTFLNVPCHFEDVSLAIRKCWASMWQERLLSYRKQHNIAATELPAMAVVIQHQLNPKASGVLFTMNPINGSTNQIVVESCYGLGEGVVCGEISPHTFVIDWPSRSVLSRDVTTQSKKFSFSDTYATNGGFIGLVSTTADERATSSLDDSHVLDLAQLGIQVACFYQHPQDIEWALLDNGELYILSASSYCFYS